jgi:biopolymer transport protein ExbD
MSRKRTSPSASQGVQLGLIITPMLDMAFQILAFFIMTYHPSALEAHIPGSLVPDNPAIRDAHPPLPAPEVPLPAEKELLEGLEDAVSVKVKAIAKGQEVGTRVAGSPSQIFILVPPAIEAELVADVDVEFPVALARLEAKLKGLRKNAANKANLKIAADGDLRQQYVMAVYDTARKAGFDKVHFVPPPVLNAKAK